MRVLVVDDEPLVRRALTDILSQRSDIDDYATAADTASALKLLRGASFDVLLLDIQMPEQSGLEMLEELCGKHEPKPSVIFVTAFQEHALAAFEKHAVDYVLKPFSAARLNDALNIAVRRSQHERAAQLLEALKEVRLGAKQSPRVALKDRDRVIFTDLSDLFSAEAHGNYVLLQQRSGSLLMRTTISAVEAALGSYGFVRIHRSILINGSLIESIESGVGSECVVRLKNGKEYSVTRTYRENLKGAAQCWLGTDTIRLR